MALPLIKFPGYDILNLSKNKRIIKATEPLSTVFLAFYNDYEKRHPPKI